MMSYCSNSEDHMTRHKNSLKAAIRKNSVYSEIKMLYKINLMYLMTHNCFYATYVGF